MKSNSTGRSIARDEVAHEHERALEHADEQRRPALVVGGDLLAELADARLQLVLADDDAPDRARSTAGEASRRQLEAASRSDAPRAHPRARSHACRRRATASTRSTSAIDGGGAPSQLPHRAARERRRERDERARTVGGSASGHAARPRARRGTPTLNAGCRPGGRARARGRARRAPTSIGSTSWRITTRRNARSSFIGSSSDLERRARRTAPACRPAGSRAAAAPRRPRRGAMPASPDAAAPRSTLSSTVSAWSSAVWPTSTTSAPSSTPRLLERLVARVARARASRFGPGIDRDHASARNPAPRRAAIARDGVAPRRRCRAAARGRRAPRPARGRRRRRARAARRSRRRPSTPRPPDAAIADLGGELLAPRRARPPPMRWPGHADSSGVAAAGIPARARSRRASTRASQSSGRLSSSIVGRHSGPRHAASIARGSGLALDRRDERLADLVLAHLRLEPDQLLQERGHARVLCRRACSTRAMRACPATCSRRAGSSPRCRGLRAATSAPARCASAPRCSSLASSATRPPSSSGLRPLRNSSAARAQRLHEPRGSGSIDDERALDQRQVVGLHPGHAGELRPVGDLVDRDPEPEVAGPEREALLQREDVAADVVDGVGRRRRRRARAGRTDRARAATR